MQKAENSREKLLTLQVFRGISMKSLYSYLFIQQIITANPATKLVTDKNTERLPQILTSREVELLLEQPRCVDAKGYRDRARENTH